MLEVNSEMTLPKTIIHCIVFTTLFVISGFDFFTLVFLLFIFVDVHNKNTNENNQPKIQTLTLFAIIMLIALSHHQIISHIFKNNKTQLCGTVIQSHQQSFSRSPLVSPNLIIKNDNQTKAFRVNARTAQELNSQICVTYLDNNSISFFDDYVLDIQKVENLS